MGVNELKVNCVALVRQVQENSPDSIFHGVFLGDGSFLERLDSIEGVCDEDDAR